MWSKLQIDSEPGQLRNPLLIVSVSTSNPQYRLLYSQARELGKYLVKKLNFRQIAALYSSALSPEIRIAKGGVVSLVSNNFYLHSGKSRDYVLFAGHSSPISDEYEYGELMLSHAEKLGVKELVSIGARWTDPALSPLEPPKVIGFANDADGVARLKDAGVNVMKSESAFYFANLLVPLSKFYGMRAFKLSVDHGEPIPHPKSIAQFLAVLEKMFALQVDHEDLEAQAKDLAEAIKKAEIEGIEVGEDEGGEMMGGRRSPKSDDIYR